MPGYAEQAVSFGPFTLHRADKRLFEAGREVRMGERTLDLLIALVERAGEVVGKQSLISCVWGDSAVEETTLRAHIAALRTVLGEGESGRRYIVNVAGRGYCFVAEAQMHRAAIVPDAQAHRDASQRHNLPDLLTRVIGRDELIATIAEQLSRRRFVCIAGAAGMGKTTVALAIAERALARYPDGIRFVDLSLISDPALVPSAFAGALGTVVPAEQAIAGLVRFLADKSMLVVLDNCEHVAEAAAEVVVALLKATANLHVLATSREPLRAEGEWVQRLPPLEVPPAEVELTADQALAYPAVRLFVERAIASVDSFALADRDAGLAREICRRLDGMPLAIELAAARMAAFGIRGLMRALDDRLGTLTSRQRTGLPRHRTLVALLDWSHEMLPPAERTAFRRLSLFRAGFSLQSAQAVVAGDDIDARQVVDAVASLAAKSLLSAEFRQREVQYRMLETTRDYAWRQLVASGELAAVQRRHASRTRELLESGAEVQKSLSRSERTANYAWLMGDVRAALDWAFGDGGDVAIGAPLAAATVELSSHLSLHEEFRGRLGVALDRVRTLQPPALLTEMRLNIYFAAVTYHTRGPCEAMASANERASALAQAPEVAEHRSEAAHAAWTRAFAFGDYDAALDCVDALAVMAQGPLRAALALTVDRIRAQSLHFAGRHEAARGLVERVIGHPTRANRLTIVQALALDRNVAMRIILARLHWIEGRPEQAARVAEECVELAGTDVPFGVCQSLAFAACPIALWTGDLEAARHGAQRLMAQATEKNFLYWRRWGENFLRLLAMRDAGDAWPRETPPPTLDIDPLDAKQRDLFGALGVFDGDSQVVERAERDGNWCAAEILRLHGEWLLRRDAPDLAFATERFERALALARSQGALAWELRAATSLARLMDRTGRRSEAMALLAPIHARFTEGLASADLVAARRLLDALAA